jgi:iron complex outermembrane recepter protein
MTARGSKFRRSEVALIVGLLVASSASVQAADASDADSDLGEVVVTGSRIVRDGVTAPTPVTIVGTERIERLGATDIGAVLNTLPAFRASSSPQTSNIGPANAGMTQADLRGLSPVRTLVLVNGNRFMPSTLQGTVDLGQIPTILIERAEVVTGGASAQYGSDAVAGVVNLILKNNLDGVKTNLQYGGSFDSDARDYRASLAAGSNYAAGQGNLTFALDYNKNEGVGSCYTRDWCAQEYQVISNTGAGRIASLPVNNILPNTRNVRAVPGGLIIAGAGSASVLAGTAFNADGSPRTFQFGQVFPGSATFMSGGEGDNGFIKAPLIVVPTERYMGYLLNSFEFANGIQSSVELSAGHMESNGRGAQTRDFNGFTIRGDNPYIPAALRTRMTTSGIPLTAASSFTLGRMGDDFGYTNNLAENNVYRGVLGLKGNIAGSWNWDASAQYGKSLYEQVVENNRIEQQTPGVVRAGACNITAAGTSGPGCTRQQLAADAVLSAGQIVCRSTLTNPTNGCRPVNMFGLNNWSQEAYNYLYGTGRVNARYEQTVVAANVQGDLFNTWAGTVPLAAGIEYRENTSASNPDPISATGGFYVSNSAAISGSVEVKEAYLETSVPLAKELPFANSLELNGAVRTTDYNTSGNVTAWKYGVVYEPLDWLRFRGTRSRDIRAPNVNELYAPQSTGFATVDNQLVQQTTGGNPALIPESADTFTVGMTVRGEGWLDGLRASVDYYDIDIANAISASSGQLLANRCRQFGVLCSAVDFNPAGAVIAVRATQQNLLRLQASGIDYEVNYRMPLSRVFDAAAGILDFNVLASRSIHLRTTDLAGIIERAGQTGGNVSGGLPGLPHWTLNGTITYTTGPLSTTVEARYIQSGIYDATLIGPEQPGYSVSLPNSINTNRVNGATYVNLGATWKLTTPKANDVELFAGIQNLFDHEPPVAPSNQGSSNLILFDPIGRALRIGARITL